MRDWLRDWKFWAWAAPVAGMLAGGALYAAEQIRKVPPLEQAVQEIAAERKAVRSVLCFTIKACEEGPPNGFDPGSFRCQEAQNEAMKRRLECEVE